MRTGPENYGQGEPASPDNNEAQTAIQKIQAEVNRIQSMIKDMEAKALAEPAQRNVLLSVVEKEKANLAQKRTELTTLLLQKEKEGDDAYLIKKPPVEEFWVESPKSDEEAFDAAHRAFGEYQAADKLDAAEKRYRDRQV